MAFPVSVWFSVIFVLVFSQLSVGQVADPVQTDLRRQVRELQQQLTQCQTELRQVNRERYRLRATNSRLAETAQTRADSVWMLLATERELDSLLVVTRLQNETLTQSLTERTNQLTEARRQMAHYDYDRKTLADPTVLRLYHAGPADVRQTLLAALNRPDSGFTFDEDPAPLPQLRISRAFDSQVEAWWLFDKTVDSILELTLLIKPHPFERQQTVLVAGAKLLQKNRFSNKPFELQHDPEKTNLYRDKAMRLLEGDLRGTSDK